MTNKPQVALLVELAEKRRDAAARRLGASLSQLRESSARLDMLERYREEYRRRLGEAGTRGLGAEELRNWRGFFERLEEAVAQQRAEMTAVQGGVEALRGRWIAERQRERSFGMLAERAAAEQRLKESRREQKQAD